MTAPIPGRNFTTREQTGILKGIEALTGANPNAEQEQTRSIAPGPVERSEAQKRRQNQGSNGSSRDCAAAGSRGPETVTIFRSDRQSYDTCAI
jgi:hypothetical protein